MRKLEKKRERKLKILIMASEMYPFAKIGGLADVVSSLAGALKKTGHDVRVVIPKYGIDGLLNLKMHVKVEPMGVWMGNTEEWCSVSEIKTDQNVPVYCIDHQSYFSRDGLYHDSSMHDYDDNPVRFGFFSRAALQLCKDIKFKPDVIHVNDWQTALAPAYLKIWHWNDSTLGNSASLLTIHNVAYQGIYPKDHFEYLGLGWHNFTEEKMESFDKINFLKAGIFYSDVITAVSPSFAKEITTPSGGFGLAPYLTKRSADLVGIINGIDYSIWNPETDTLIPAHYSPTNLRGKSSCKRYLQKSFDLAVDNSIPVIGAIGRFVEQKGFHLIAQCIEKAIQNLRVQFVILGSGEKNLENFFGSLPSAYSGNAGSYIGFDNKRAHLIEAGCDFFLMPSLFEPCGLNQMYSQHYGTLPIVRATGGLDDTVLNYDEKGIDATGFKFWDPTADALYHAIESAVNVYYNKPGQIRKMIRTAMTQDFSWEKSSKLYENAYKHAIINKQYSVQEYRPYYW